MIRYIFLLTRLRQNLIKLYILCSSDKTVKLAGLDTYAVVIKVLV